MKSDRNWPHPESRPECPNRNQRPETGQHNSISVVVSEKGRKLGSCVRLIGGGAQSPEILDHVLVWHFMKAPSSSASCRDEAINLRSSSNDLDLVGSAWNLIRRKIGLHLIKSGNHRIILWVSKPSSRSRYVWQDDE